MAPRPLAEPRTLSGDDVSLQETMRARPKSMAIVSFTKRNVPAPFAANCDWGAASAISLSLNAHWDRLEAEPTSRRRRNKKAPITSGVRLAKPHGSAPHRVSYRNRTIFFLRPSVWTAVPSRLFTFFTYVRCCGASGRQHLIHLRYPHLSIRVGGPSPPCFSRINPAFRILVVLAYPRRLEVSSEPEAQGHGTRGLHRTQPSCCRPGQLT